MTLDLEAIKRRVEAATPGPWEEHPDGSLMSDAVPGGARVADVMQPEDNLFLAHAREDVPALLDKVETLRQLFEGHLDEYNQERNWRESFEQCLKDSRAWEERARQLLQELQWLDHGLCPVCHSLSHAPDCRLAALLG